MTERARADEDDAEDDVGDGGDGEEPERGVAGEASYVCSSCGEEIVVPLDPSEGERQSYVEDCPVCCVPNEITVEYDEDGTARVWSRAE